MLYLISMGLRDEKDLPVRAMETAKKCDILYAEFYTNCTASSAGKLSKLVGKPVKELDRKGMEDDVGRLIKEASASDVGIFVPGDALSATTHIMLIKEAKEAGVKTKVVHGSSIFTAIAETGLQLYKFGRTVTLTSPAQKSTLDSIKANMDAGLHTLVLLDIDMDAMTGLKLLEETIKDRKVAVACQLGSSNSLIRYGTASQLLNKNQAELKGKIPAVIAIPCKLHFSEEEFLEGLK